MSTLEKKFTAQEVAESFQCSKRTVTRAATAFSIGDNIGGRAGYRFTQAEVDRLWEALRPVQVVQSEDRRSRRSA